MPHMTTRTKSGGNDERRLLIGAAELGDLLGVGKSTIWSWHSAGRIPQPVHIGGTTRWRQEEIEDWLEAGAPPREKWMVARDRMRAVGKGVRKSGRACQGAGPRISE